VRREEKRREEKRRNTRRENKSGWNALSGQFWRAATANDAARPSGLKLTSMQRDDMAGELCEQETMGYRQMVLRATPQARQCHDSSCKLCAVVGIDAEEHSKAAKCVNVWGCRQRLRPKCTSVCVGGGKQELRSSRPQLVCLGDRPTITAKIRGRWKWAPPMPMWCRAGLASQVVAQRRHSGTRCGNG